MNIFIPRCVAETSIPYAINKIKKKFVKIKKIFLITRNENSEIMKNIMYVDEVLTINTKTFNKKTKILNNFFYKKKDDIILIPISNKNKIQSYNNVYKFIKKNFKECKIYYYDYAQNNIFEYKNNFNFFTNVFVIIFTILLFTPLLIIIFLIIISNLFRDNE